jgi:hypothetical protein
MSDHHRRDFVRALAFTTALGGTVVADEPVKDVKEEPRPSEADARMALVLARFGTQLDADARKAIRAEIEDQVRRAATLRKIPLDNGDGPFPVFHPYRAPLA